MACKSKICNPPGGADGAGASPGDVSPEVVEFLKQFQLSDDDLKQYMDLFLDNIERGLKKETNPTAIVKCFPTYVQDLPTGKEEGKFLALDLGGTNFRVLIIELGGGECNMDSDIYVLPPDVIVGEGDKLFDHIAQCLDDFVKKRGLTDNLPLGFTFSFPLTQKGLSVGILERWTKGFNCPDVIGKDVVELLNQAIQRRGDLAINVVAVLNDTTGTLMSCAWKNPDTKIGLIVGTGSNACYVEKQSNAELFDEPDMGSGNVIINMEMGAFGDDGCLDYIRTEFDKDVDENSINAGRQLHEKMISGMYMGELVRQLLVKFTKDGLMFGGKGSDKLFERSAFETRYVSEIEADPPGVYTNVQKVCAELGISDATEQDYINTRYACQMISSRAAHLVSAAMVTVMHKMGYDSVSVGIDGTVYKSHPHFHNIMNEKIAQMLRPGIKFSLMLSEDGSGKGAALIAAVAASKAQAAQAAQEAQE